MVLSIQSLSKSFGAVQVAANVSFNIKAGEAVGIIGPNRFHS